MGTFASTDAPTAASTAHEAQVEHLETTTDDDERLDWSETLSWFAALLVGAAVWGALLLLVLSLL